MEQRTNHGRSVEKSTMCVDDQILSRKSCNPWIYRHSVINSTLCGQVIILQRGSRSVDKFKFCGYVHIILTTLNCNFDVDIWSALLLALFQLYPALMILFLGCINPRVSSWYQSYSIMPASIHVYPAALILMYLTWINTPVSSLQ